MDENKISVEEVDDLMKLLSRGIQSFTSEIENYVDVDENNNIDKEELKSVIIQSIQEYLDEELR